MNISYLIHKGDFRFLFSKFTNQFDINLHTISENFHNKGEAVLLLTDKTDYHDFMNTLETYYQVNNNDKLVQLKTQKKAKVK